MAMADAAKVVSDFRQTMGRGDFASARRLLHDHLSFRGPIGVFETADAFIEAWKALPMVVERVEVRKVFADGSDVCVLFDLVTKRPAVTVLVAEWYRVTDARITMMQAVFDARPFAAVLRKDAG
jgi:limonene-1,2-epoxide hydrolase